DLMGLVHQVLRLAVRQAGQVTDQVGVDRVAAVGVLAQRDLRSDARRAVQGDLLAARDQLQRAEEAGRVPGREQLLGVGALTAAAGRLGRAGGHVEAVVGGLDVAVAASTGCRRLCGVDDLDAHAVDHARLARTPSSMALPRSGSTLRQYSNTRESTGSSTPL